MVDLPPVSYTHLDVYKRQKFSTALQVIVLPLPDWPNKIKDSPSLIAKDISETELSVPDRRLMLKGSIISDGIIGCPPPASEYHGVLLQIN